MIGRVGILFGIQRENISTNMETSFDLLIVLALLGVSGFIAYRVVADLVSPERPSANLGQEDTNLAVDLHRRLLSRGR
jgi:hypothetical protein